MNRPILDSKKTLTHNYDEDYNLWYVRNLNDFDDT